MKGAKWRIAHEWRLEYLIINHDGILPEYLKMGFLKIVSHGVTRLVKAQVANYGTAIGH